MFKYEVYIVCIRFEIFISNYVFFFLVIYIRIEILKKEEFN